jgi:hypothetical protein
MPPARAASRLRLLALATDNWLGRTHLAVFAASVAVMFLFPESGFAPDLCCSRHLSSS